MKNIYKTVFVSSLLVSQSAFAGAPCPVTCEAPSFESGVTVGYDSQYLFRGINFGNDLVTAAVDTAWTCERTGLDLSAGVWYGSTSQDAGSADELNLIFGATKDLGFAAFTLGYTQYHFFNQADDAQEVSFGLSKDLCGGVSASLTYFWDVETDNNGYSELALAKSFELASKSLDLGFALGYEAEEGKISHATTKLEHAIALSDTATLTPYVAHAWDLGAEDVFGSQENEFFAGAALSVTF